MKNEWKESLKVENTNNGIILNEAAINGIEGARRIPEKELTYMKSSEYKAIVEETNDKIEKDKRKEKIALINAKNFIAGER